MISSKLTSKAQTTIPQPVRVALRLEPGDELVYEIVDQRVILTRARTSGRADDPFRTFHEWSTEADAEAYAEL
ncbi:MAG: AbrB/MazE/SpoVT family DNA-binding domain-containing protein [Immundisolibacter sp.]|uniref:AbrB/MazE/SpoVT family DNA-binding domain-containing protein n=1 Tax=Immundisolibacter sp. TaxID=1934948 RepID=UPI003EE34986